MVDNNPSEDLQKLDNPDDTGEGEGGEGGMGGELGGGGEYPALGTGGRGGGGGIAPMGIATVPSSSGDTLTLIPPPWCNWEQKCKNAIAKHLGRTTVTRHRRCSEREK